MDFKDKEHFDLVADQWYQRTKRLLRYGHNEDNPSDKRAKAFLLGNIMAMRMLKISQVYLVMSQPRFFKFLKGTPAKINYGS